MIAVLFDMFKWLAAKWWLWLAVLFWWAAMHIV